MISVCRTVILAMLVWSLSGCATPMEIYRDPNMDFGAVRTVAILPFVNLTRESAAAERVRDTLTTMLLATGGVYVIPSGEVARGLSRGGVANPSAPTTEELLKLAGVIKADAVITGTVREYGEVRSGSATANVISLSTQLIEAQTGKVVWSASTTKGGIGVKDRLFGGGGAPMNDITEQAVNEIIKKLFQ